MVVQSKDVIGKSPLAIILFVIERASLGLCACIYFLKYWVDGQMLECLMLMLLLHFNGYSGRL